MSHAAQRGCVASILRGSKDLTGCSPKQSGLTSKSTLLWAGGWTTDLLKSLLFWILWQETVRTVNLQWYFLTDYKCTQIFILKTQRVSACTQWLTSVWISLGAHEKNRSATKVKLKLPVSIHITLFISASSWKLFFWHINGLKIHFLILSRRYSKDFGLGTKLKGTGRVLPSSK